eukprot:scaffold243340_cov26-Tisochrysis_lutea.AAC.1
MRHPSGGRAALRAFLRRSGDRGQHRRRASARAECTSWHQATSLPIAHPRPTTPAPHGAPSTWCALCLPASLPAAAPPAASAARTTLAPRTHPARTPTAWECQLRHPLPACSRWRRRRKWRR